MGGSGWRKKEERGRWAARGLGWEDRVKVWGTNINTGGMYESFINTIHADRKLKGRLGCIAILCQV